jgi:hypothetical protein
MRYARVLVLLITALLVGAPTVRADQITSFGQLGTTNLFFATNNGDGTTTLSSTASVGITNIASGAIDPNALFVFEADSLGDAQLFIGPGGGEGIFQEYAGTFSLTNQAGTFNYLSGTFGGALFAGGNNGTGAVFTANTTTFDPLFLFTDLPLVLMSPESFSLSLSNVTAPLHIDGFGSDATVASFTASYTGTADATFQQLEVVPEPGTLTLMGTGLVWAANRVRRRRKT